jgi:hypothetical protein
VECRGTSSRRLWMRSGMLSSLTVPNILALGTRNVMLHIRLHLDKLDW